MLPRSTIDRLIEILRKDARRALKMKVPGFPRPYYCSFLLRDIKWFNTWASSGSTYRRRSDHTRNVFCDIRVGSYRNDQTTEGGLNDNDDELDSYSFTTLPIDDKDHSALRIALWRLSEAKFREALSDYNLKEAARVSTVDKNRSLRSFTKYGGKKSIKYRRPEKVDEESWRRFCKRASKWISELPRITGNWVEFDATRETHIFVSTENRVIVQHFQTFSLMCALRHLSKEGVMLEQEVVINVGSLKELPDMRKFKQLVMEKHDRLVELAEGKAITSFSGPVLLCPGPAGLLFHEAIGHRLEGSRLLSSGEGRTFKDYVGKKVLNVDLTVRDDPTLKRYQGKRVIGAYDFDDEGVPAEDTLLIEDGVLREFLSTRAQLPCKSYKPNGHARCKKYQRPISRMAVTIIEGHDENAKSYEELKELLVEQVKEQGKQYGMIVCSTSGGETGTTNFDFQAFYGEVTFALLVDKKGREFPVRGVNLVGTPLQALSNIIAYGDEYEIDNGYCGAESGMLPVTTISPALLLRNLELQAKDEEVVTQSILPRPRL